MFVERLRDAINAHNLDEFTACFADDYQSEQPVHPARAFRGAHQVRQNWGTFFHDVPDIEAELIGSATGQDDVEWGEWRWRGTKPDGSPFHMRGATVMGIRDDRISWGRLYMEEVEESGEDIDRAVDRLAGTRTPDSG